MKHALLVAASALAQLVLSSPLENQLLDPRADSCGSNLQTCSPSDASSETLPALGPDLSSLYLSLLDSVKGIHFKRNLLAAHRRSTPSFCCATGTSCLTLSTYSVPFCYDKFTTNFVFPDGSSGTIATGSFTGADSASADLLTGAFTNGSTTGNIYAADPAARPNTATLSIPPQYTASGVGSAIPLTALGTVVVVTTTVSESVLLPTTIPASTVPGTTVAGVTTRADSIVPATTVEAASTVSAHESVMTVTRSSASASGTAAAASASQTGGAEERGAAALVVGAAAAAAAAWALV